MTRRKGGKRLKKACLREPERKMFPGRKKVVALSEMTKRGKTKRGKSVSSASHQTADPVLGKGEEVIKKKGFSVGAIKELVRKGDASSACPQGKGESLRAKKKKKRNAQPRCCEKTTTDEMKKEKTRWAGDGRTLLPMGEAKKKAETRPHIRDLPPPSTQGRRLIHRGRKEKRLREKKAVSSITPSRKGKPSHLERNARYLGKNSKKKNSFPRRPRRNL